MADTMQKGKAVAVAILVGLAAAGVVFAVYEGSVIPQYKSTIDDKDETIDDQSSTISSLRTEVRSLQTTAGERPASITASISNSTFADASSAVDANGTVSTETSYTTYITIENPDEIDAEDIVITLYNPLTEKGGLHDNIEVDEFEAYVSSGGKEHAIFYSGDYIESGFDFGDIGQGGTGNITVKVTFTEAVAGTFQDGQSYDCYYYVWQSTANYVTPVSFTVQT